MLAAALPMVKTRRAAGRRAHSVRDRPVKIAPPLFVIAGIAALALLFWWLRPAPGPQPVVTTANLAAPAAAATPAAADLLPPAMPPRSDFRFVIAGGKLVSAPATMSVPQGRSLSIQVQSDRDDELHLHGYDLSLPVSAGTMAELVFEAKRSGRFPLELHESRLELGALEVQPAP